MKTINQIKKAPLSERTVSEEYLLAKQGKCQPRCLYCLELLEIEQPLLDYIKWAWDQEKKRYKRYDIEGDAEKPRCSKCCVADRGFVDEDLMSS